MDEDSTGPDSVAMPKPRIVHKAMRAFLQSILKKTGCNSQVLLTSAVYLQRVRASGAYRVTHSSFCILSTVCLYLATKFLHDKVYSVKHWATSSGFTAVDILSAERLLLDILKFELFVSSDTLLLFLRERAPADSQIAFSR